MSEPTQRQNRANHVEPPMIKEVRDASEQTGAPNEPTELSEPSECANQGHQTKRAIPESGRNERTERNPANRSTPLIFPMFRLGNEQNHQ